MKSDDLRNYKILFMADGETDYLFLEKVFRDDPDLSPLPITMLRPEDVNLKRRVGGGHDTLRKELGFAAIKAAQGYADGVFALVDNDGDARFQFPHEHACGDCRECEAQAELRKIHWGQPFEKGAAILFQALETLLLSTRNDFTPQLEESLHHENLKVRLYGRHFNNPDDMFVAFQKVLSQITIHDITARAYPRLKQHLSAMVRIENRDSCRKE